MKNSYLYIFILVFVILCGCSSSEKIIMKNKFTLGNYSYKISDSSLTMLASGTIKADYYKGNEISGTYSVVKDETVPFEGMETMNDGPFSGNYNDTLSLVFFNLNPRMAFIFAKDYSDSLKGTWYYSTFRGKQSGGFFSAKRVKK
jgi:hypothetical protein